MTATTPVEPTELTLAEGDKRMFIRLRKRNYAGIHASAGYQQWLDDHAGQWIEVDTEYLFTNQYNTTSMVNGDGSFSGGYRLYDSMIDAVRNDARVGKGKCKYCGNMVNTGEGCSKHVECIIYGIDWFTEKNTYFLKYPAPPEIQVKEIEPVKVETYTLEYSSYSQCFILRNCRKTIRFRFFDSEYWVFSGIGYTRRKYLDIPASLTTKIKEAINKFIITQP